MLKIIKPIKTFSKRKELMKRIYTTETPTPLRYDEGKEPIKMVAIGATGALIGTVAGVGAGIILIPLLANYTNLSRHQTSAASLAGILGNGVATAITLFSLGCSIDMWTVATIGISGALSSRIGAKYGKSLTENQLAVAFAILMFCVGIFVFVYDHYHSDKRKEIEAKYFVFALSGLVIGFISGLLGIGGATFYVPLLFSTTTLPHLTLVGTALCSTLIPGMVGVYSHHKLGNLVLYKALYVALGAFIGGAIGTKLAEIVDDTYLKKIFSVVAILLGARKLIAYKLQKKVTIK